MAIKSFGVMDWMSVLARVLAQALVLFGAEFGMEGVGQTVASYYSSSDFPFERESGGYHVCSVLL